MATLSDDWIERLGPSVLPFERRQFSSKIAVGEDILFADETIDGNAGVRPIDAPLLSVETILNSQPVAGKYLWIIDYQGLKLLPEATPNPYAARQMVCHTNITGGRAALQGGELWFGDDGKVYINNKSGRYGANTIVQQTAVLDYFRSLSYDVVQLPAYKS